MPRFLNCFLRKFPEYEEFHDDLATFFTVQVLPVSADRWRKLLDQIGDYGRLELVEIARRSALEWLTFAPREYRKSNGQINAENLKKMMLSHNGVSCNFRLDDKLKPIPCYFELLELGVRSEYIDEALRQLVEGL